jgi:AcrR family transcriptional regulator
MPRSSEPKRRTRLPAEQRRGQLLDAAAAAILEDGFDGLSMETVTDRAGVSKALGYAYFNRLDDLLHELFDREFSAIYDRLRPRLTTDEAIEDRIRGKVESYFQIIEERHDLYLSLNTNLRGPTYRKERRERHAAWEGFVAEIVQAEFVVDDEASRVVARLLMMIDDRCVQMWTRDGRPRQEMEELCSRFQIAALEGMFERRNRTV